MSTYTGLLAGVDMAFGKARGLAADERWCARAIVAMAGENVDAHHMREALDEALAILRAAEGSETAEPIDSLLGAPEEWSAARIARWREDGIDAFESEAMTPADLLLFGVGLACLFSVLFGLVGWGSEGYPIGVALMPLPMAWAVLGCGFWYQRVMAARSGGFVKAVGAAVCWGLASALALAGLAWAMQGLPRAPMWMVMLPAAAVYACATWLIGRWWKQRDTHRTLTADELFEGDSAWMADFGAALRLRGDMSDRDVKRLTDDARRFAAESGTRLVEEFGPARVYAQRFPRSTLKELRIVMFWTSVVLLIDIPYLIATYAGYAGHGDWSMYIAHGILIGGVISLATAILRYRRQRGIERATLRGTVDTGGSDSASC